MTCHLIVIQINDDRLLTSMRYWEGKRTGLGGLTTGKNSDAMIET